ncbi:DNA integrity scanning protein DisA nucleotide-binding domain protein [Neorhodopirellula pilleata]|uniref:DisA bacterial checkpoint controller nucleotide-binding protein n=1 Tax=Neorhodopirellula pilleata TaxID=2714738 RepID=A0A5C6AAB6_9BACT|nr:DNA integrity scanning protein DisA nucleotide-binding domain protein [Neorhodopirellula pilleata]TWT96386.1 DisA bacterial checkpoint controller nucleotide-binding protein [Neorhodopirellula pilleata]
MATQRLTKHNASMIRAGVALKEDRGADAILLLLDGSTDWKRISELAESGKNVVIVAVDTLEDLDGAAEAGLKPLALNKEKAPLLERLQEALLEAAADELIRTNGEVVAVYSGFQQGRLDSISHLQLDERMRRFTVRDLQTLESSVPLKTIKAVVDLASQIGREGREGKPVGTMFVVGDTRKVLEHANDSGVDPFRGYNKKHRNLLDPKVQEDAKEVAQLDGAFVVTADGVIERSRQMLEVTHEDLKMTKGLGSRHWAAAAITRKSKAVSVVVSQSTGTVRLYQNGFLILQIVPMDKAIKWQEFAFEPPPQSSED